MIKMMQNTSMNAIMTDSTALMSFVLISAKLRNIKDAVRHISANSAENPPKKRITHRMRNRYAHAMSSMIFPARSAYALRQTNTTDSITPHMKKNTTDDRYDANTANAPPFSMPNLPSHSGALPAYIRISAADRSIVPQRIALPA